MKRKLKPYSSYYNANILEVIQQKSIDPDDFSMAENQGTNCLQCYQTSGCFSYITMTQYPPSDMSCQLLTANYQQLFINALF